MSGLDLRPNCPWAQSSIWLQDGVWTGIKSMYMLGDILGIWLGAGTVAQWKNIAQQVQDSFCPHDSKKEEFS